MLRLDSRADRVLIPADVIRYVRAAEKGVNDKTRRNDRHTVLMTLVGGYLQ
jgi:hypothetical protein